jgi:hypothetical protein
MYDNNSQIDAKQPPKINLSIGGISKVTDPSEEDDAVLVQTATKQIVILITLSRVK